MFFSKKKVEDNLGNGVGGYGLTLPKSKEGLKVGWWCPNCENIYSPKITECKCCNKALEELRKAEVNRKKNSKQRRSTD